MKTRKMSVIKAGMKVGAVLGGAAFLLFGIVPGFHYGGFATVMLLSKMAGGPLEFTLGVHIIVILGVLIGILSLGFMSIVLGSILGTVSGFFVDLLSPAAAPDTKGTIKDRNA